MNVKQAFQCWSLKNISEKSWYGIVPVTGKMHFQVPQEAACPSQCSSYHRAGFTNFNSIQYSRKWGEFVLSPELIFLSGTNELPLNASACLVKGMNPYISAWQR